MGRSKSNKPRRAPSDVVVERGELDRSKLDRATHYRWTLDPDVGLVPVTGRKRCPVCHHTVSFDMEGGLWAAFNQAHVVSGCARRAYEEGIPGLQFMAVPPDDE